jgi:hypothetical protein
VKRRNVPIGHCSRVQTDDNPVQLLTIDLSGRCNLNAYWLNVGGLVYQQCTTSLFDIHALAAPTLPAQLRPPFEERGSATGGMICIGVL